MKPKRCICGREVEVVQDNQGYEVSCERCGKRSGHYPRERYAIMEWNRPKDVLDMVGREGVNSVVIA